MNLKALFGVAAMLVAFHAFTFNAWAIEPNEVLSDPALETRAREVGKNLRCVVCQNQSIDDSNAELAGDMRVLVRERIMAGDSNSEVMAYMVDRYGDFVLLDPPFKASTYVLWVGPPVIAVLGVFWLISVYRRNMASATDAQTSSPSGAQASPLSDEERRRLDALLKDKNA